MPRLEKLFFASVSAERSVNEDGMVGGQGKYTFEMMIEPEVSVCDRPGEHDVLLTCAVLTLRGRSHEASMSAKQSKELDEVPAFSAHVTARAYFRHPKGTDRAKALDTSTAEQNFDYFMMQIYPPTVERLKDLMEGMGFSGLKLPIGLPERPASKHAVAKKARKPSLKSKAAAT